MNGNETILAVCLKKGGNITKILVGIPCYNEEATIRQVINDLNRQMGKVIGLSSGDYSIAVFDDGSTDQSVRIAAECGAVVIRHGTNNKGLGETFASIHEYFFKHRFDFLITVDGDSQFDASDIHSLLGAVRDEGYDFCSGSRFLSKETSKSVPPARRIGNQVFARFIGLSTGIKVSDSTCGFRVYSRKALSYLALTGGFSYTQETIIQLAAAKIKMTERPISVRYFKTRHSPHSHNLFRFGIRSAAMSIRTLIRYRTSFLIGLTSLITLIPGMFGFAIFLNSYFQTGRFSGNLWLGFSSASLIFSGLAFAQISVLAKIINDARTISLITLSEQRRKGS